MIVVNAVLESTAAGIEALKSAIATMEQESRAEPGCLDYTFSVELNRPHVIRITEKWASLEALTEHFRTPHMAAFREAMGRHPPTAATASFFEVKEIPPPQV